MLLILGRRRKTKDKSISLDFNSSLFSISFAYCSRFTIYFDKEKHILSILHYSKFGKGNKTKDESMISLDFKISLFSISFAYCSQFIIYFDTKRSFEVFLTCLHLVKETRLSKNP